MELTRRQALLGAAALLSQACPKRSPPRPDPAPRDAAGPHPDAGPPARRIVSLAPNATELLFALGAGDRVVGVSDLCGHPPEATRLPRVGTMVDPRGDVIRGLNPDTLVGVQGPFAPAVIDPIRARGVRLLFPQIESLADVRHALADFAALVGRPEAAPAYLQRMDAELAAVRQRLQGRPRPKVAAIVSQNPVVVAGQNSWVQEVFMLAGGDPSVLNVNRYPMLTMEQVLATAPEVVLDLTWHQHVPPLETAWSSDAGAPEPDAAVLPRPGRYVRVEDVAVIRPGPRVVHAVKTVARALHPDVQW